MKTKEEILDRLSDAQDGNLDYNECYEALREVRDYIAEPEPYAYTYVHIDGKRMWRMASSRITKPESGWIETALYA